MFVGPALRRVKPKVGFHAPCHGGAVRPAVVFGSGGFVLAGPVLLGTYTTHSPTSPSLICNGQQPTHGILLRLIASYPSDVSQPSHAGNAQGPSCQVGPDAPNLPCVRSSPRASRTSQPLSSVGSHQSHVRANTGNPGGGMSAHSRRVTRTPLCMAPPFPSSRLVDYWSSSHSKSTFY